MLSQIPIPDTLPVHWWWFQVLLLFTFLVHVLLMNFVLGGSLITIVSILRRKETGPETVSLPTLVALTINFGIPPLLFVQVLYGHLFYSSSILMAVPWILVIPILIAAYYGAHIYSHQITHKPSLARTSLIISGVLLLYIAFVYVNNSTLALTPDRWNLFADRPGGGSLNWGEPTLIPRYLHFVIGAIAIAGLGKALWYRFNKQVTPEVQQQNIRSGLKTFGWVTLIQMGIGTWFWLALPNEMWKLFMGQNLAYTVLMVIGWLLALLILHSALTNRFWTSLGFGLLTLIIMIIMRDLVRHAYLGEVFHPRDLAVTGEVSPLLAFLVVFVVGLLAIFYMIRMIIKPKTVQP